MHLALYTMLDKALSKFHGFPDASGMVGWGRQSLEMCPNVSGNGWNKGEKKTHPSWFQRLQTSWMAKQPSQAMPTGSRNVLQASGMSTSSKRTRYVEKPGQEVMRSCRRHREASKSIRTLHLCRLDVGHSWSNWSSEFNGSSWQCGMCAVISDKNRYASRSSSSSLGEHQMWHLCNIPIFPRAKHIWRLCNSQHQDSYNSVGAPGGRACCQVPVDHTREIASSTPVLPVNGSGRHPPPVKACKWARYTLLSGLTIALIQPNSLSTWYV